jgi:hypothetical protein
LAVLTNHRDHLRLAWNAVREHGEGAEEMVVAHIRAYAAAHGRSARYHDTMTRFWVRLIAHAFAVRPEVSDFDGFLAAFPQLLDKELFLRHWSQEAMFAPEARAAWRAPDLVPLPF